MTWLLSVSRHRRSGIDRHRDPRRICSRYEASFPGKPSHVVSFPADVQSPAMKPLRRLAFYHHRHIRWMEGTQGRSLSLPWRPAAFLTVRAFQTCHAGTIRHRPAVSFFYRSPAVLPKARQQTHPPPVQSADWSAEISAISADHLLDGMPDHERWRRSCRNSERPKPRSKAQADF